MKRQGGLALLASLAIAFAACGSDEKQEPSLSDKQGAEEIVLEVSDLPKGSTEAKKALVSRNCDPTASYRSYASATARPFGFVLPTGQQILQTVGVFESPNQARKAFDEITSKPARACVGAEMQRSMRVAAGGSGKLRFMPSQWSLPNETARTMRLVVVSPLAAAEVQRTAILQGRLLTSVTFISLNSSLGRDLWESVSRRSADRLDRVASSVES